MHARTNAARLIAVGAVTVLTLGAGAAEDTDLVASPEGTVSPDEAMSPGITDPTGSPSPTDGEDEPDVRTLATSEVALTSEDPTSDEPFPANLETDTGTASDDAQLSPVDLRFGVHEDYDRVVVDLSGTGTPGWTVEYVEDPTAQGSGQPVDVAGDAVLAVRIDGVVMPTEEGAEEWQGPERLVPQSAGVVQEVVRGTLFEGVQTLYIGLDSQEPFRAFDLQDPTRLVIDVYHPDVTGGEAPLPDDDPAEGDMPFPANLEPDTNEVGEGAMLSPVDLRVGVHEKFDRVVLDLAGEGVPGWRAEYVDAPTLQGSGAPVEIAGDATLKVVVQGLVYPTADGAEEYQGPQRVDPGTTGVIEEVVYGSIFEGQTEIFIGLESQEPFRVFLLEDPTRVVIDIVHPSALPAAPGQGGTYVVQPGDTLGSIAAGYDATWQEIYDANRAAIGPDPDDIQVGQQLMIPGTYVVQPGDTLSSIAAGYDATWQEIYDANRDTIGPDPDLIQIGEELTIPGG